MKHTKKKIVATVCLFLLTVLSFTFSTIAYFTDQVSAQGSNISTGDLRVELIETTSTENLLSDGSMRIMPGYVVNKSVAIKNEGTLPVWVRIRVDSLITLSAAMQGRENEIDKTLIHLNINTDAWVERDGYYYHRTAVTSGNETAPLFTTVTFDTAMGNLYKDSTILLDLTVDSLQANTNGTSPITAVGWRDIAEGGGNP